MGAPASQTVTQDIDPDFKNRMLGLYSDLGTYYNQTPYQTAPSMYGPGSYAGVAGQQPLQQAASSYLSQALLGQNLGFSNPALYGPYQTPNQQFGVSNQWSQQPYEPPVGDSGGGGPEDPDQNYGPDPNDNPDIFRPNYPGMTMSAMMPTMNAEFDPNAGPAVPPITETAGPGGLVNYTPPGGGGTVSSTGYTPPGYGGYGSYAVPGAGPADAANRDAGYGARAAMFYDPEHVIAPAAGAYGDVDPRMGYQGAQPYRNAYEDQVVGNAIGDLGRAEAMFREGGIYSKGAGTYGGDRMAIQESEANRNFLDRAGNLSARLRSAGFDTANQFAMQDANRMLQAGGLNQAAFNDMSRFNAGLGMQGQLANQQAGLAGAGLNLSGAMGLDSIGTSALNNVLSSANAMNQLGTQQQGLAQSMLDSDISQFYEARNDPLMRAQALQGILSGMPVGMSTTTYSSPQRGSSMLGGALAGAGAGAQFGPWGAGIGGLVGLLGGAF